MSTIDSGRCCPSWIMSPNHFQRQRLINTTETRVNRITNGDSDPAARAQGRRGLENGMGVAEQGLNGRCRLQRLESGNETENENEDNENNENDGEGEDDGDGPLVPFKVPGRGWMISENGCQETLVVSVTGAILITIIPPQLECVTSWSGWSCGRCHCSCSSPCPTVPSAAGRDGSWCHFSPPPSGSLVSPTSWSGWWVQPSSLFVFRQCWLHKHCQALLVWVFQWRMPVPIFRG